MTFAKGDQVSRFIRTHRDRPFFVYLATYNPHSPCSLPDKSWADPYRDMVPPHVAYFFATIARVASVCRDRGVPVGICGESAAGPKSAYLYLGMGIDRLSMNAAAVPVVKDFLRKVKRAEAEETLREALLLEETEDVSRLLEERIGSLAEQR